MLPWLLITVLGVEYLGLASRIGILRAIKFSLLSSLALFAYLAAKNGVKELLSYSQSRILLIFLGMTGASILYALIQTTVLDVFLTQVGYFILMANVFWLFATRAGMRKLLLAMIGFHVYLVFLNSGKMFRSVRAGGFEGGYFLGDGNDFAWSNVTFLPLLFLIYLDTRNRIVRLLLLGAAGIMVFGILGTSSRGATLGLAAEVACLIAMSRRKALTITVVVVMLLITALFLPSTYYDRMATIKNYEEDSSAMSRFTAWRAAVLMALDYPTGVGAGNFNSVYGRHYREKVISEEHWGTRRWISPHSIYFLTLGEYGFPGLFLLLLLLFLTIRANLRFSKRLQALTRDPPLHASFFLIMNISLTGYAVCGVFLGGVNYPHIFIYTGLAIRGYQMVKEAEGITVSTAPRSPGVPRPGTGPRRPERRRSRGRRNTGSGTWPPRR